MKDQTILLGEGLNLLINTQLKLKETEYFLMQMKKNYKKDPDYEYNFHAFLYAARATTAFLQRDIAHVPNNQKLLSYYAEKQKEMRDDKLLRFMYDARVSVEHKENPASAMTLLGGVLAPKYAKRANIKKRSVKSMLSDRVYLTSAFKNAEIKRYLPDKPKTFLGKDISNLNPFEVCRLYYGYLDRMVFEISTLLPNIEIRKLSELKPEDLYY